MTNATIVKEFTFDAAHQLVHHEGDCKNLHGHTYKLQVGIFGPIKNEPGASNDGMVWDFTVLKQIVKKQIINKLDHKFINDILPFQPTVENMAVWMVQTLRDAGLPIKFVRLYETPTSFVEVYDGDVPRA